MIQKKNDDYAITLEGIKMGDAYDKSQYKWDPNLKKVVYIKKGDRKKI